VTVAPNPSHLEMCMPVVQGLVRSLQRHRCAVTNVCFDLCFVVKRSSSSRHEQ
jgi:2-oxoglutarate dehydrogenase complex dehydrogenase (E1) component-like enzyme